MKNNNVTNFKYDDAVFDKFSSSSIRYCIDNKYTISVVDAQGIRIQCVKCLSLENGHIISIYNAGSKLYRYNKNNELIEVKTKTSMQNILKTFIKDDDFICWLMLQGYALKKNGFLQKI